MNEFLKHYGVLGMRWGKRKSRSVSSDYSRTRSLKKKHVSELSDDELTTLNKRLNLEKNYSSLNPSRVAKGKNAVTGVMKGVGAVTAFAASLTTLITLGQKIVKAKG